MIAVYFLKVSLSKDMYFLNNTIFIKLIMINYVDLNYQKIKKTYFFLFQNILLNLFFLILNKL